MDFIEKVVKQNEEDTLLAFKMRKPTKKDFDKIVGLDVEKFKKVLKREAKDLKRHFDEDGWDVNANFSSEHVLYELLGFHISDFVKAYLAPKDVILSYKKDGEPVFTDPSYVPVYFDEKGGQFILGKLEKSELIKNSHIKFIGKL